MAETTATAKGRSLPRSVVEGGAFTLGRLSSFRITYIAFFVFALLYVTSVEVAGDLLTGIFRERVARAVRVNPANGPIIDQIERRVTSTVAGSRWVRLGDVRVDVFVLGADGRTPLYVIGRSVPPPPEMDPHQIFLDAVHLLPASAEVVVSVPHDSRLSIAIFVFYASVLFTTLFFYNRRVARQEEELLTAAMLARDASAERARGIETELQQVRERLRAVEPGERAHSEEIHKLESERGALQAKLRELAEREAELRGYAERATELDQERQALEDLLDEATEDLSSKEEEIRSLQDRLKRAVRSAPSDGRRARGVETLGRRLRTLYKTLEFDERAVHDLAGLGDESKRLRAEEAIKRLADDPDTAAVRRKVGGLPPQLSIYELGFAGKGRIYYTRSEKQRYRILAIGAKNTQKTDLEYLSRL